MDATTVLAIIGGSAGILVIGALLIFGFLYVIARGMGMPR